MPKRVTLADVARAAQVSSQTVSRAINNKNEIAEATRNEILTIAERLGYRPSGIARSLATRRTTSIGLVVPDIANPFFSGIARGVEDVAYANAYNIFLCNTDEDCKREHSVLDSLLDKQVDGLILCSSRLEQAELLKRLQEFSHAVLVNRVIEPPLPNIGTITVDDALGAETAVSHLVMHGHRKIALLAGPQRSWSGRNRLQGYQSGIRKHGLAIDPALIQYCEPNTDCGRQTSLEFLAVHPEVTAMIAYNDLVAVGSLQACRELKLSVPGDIAIIGSDDIPLACLISPNLTTLHIPMQEIGNSAMQTLMAIIEAKSELHPCISLTPTLVIRESAP